MWNLLMADLRHMLAAWGDPPVRVVARTAPRVLMQGRFRAIVLIRISQVSPPWLAMWLQYRVLRACGAEVHPRAVIGPGLCLAHTTGLVVGAEARLGSNVVLYQNVTLGHGKSGRGMPSLGNEVRVHAGAVLLGPIVVGDRAVIGANATVLADVPADVVVVGVWS